MKILYLARLFSGLEPSIVDGVWRPAGVPTSYKLIEALDRSEHEVDFVFTPKDDGSLCNGKCDRRVTIDGLNSDVEVLAGPSSVPQWTGRLRAHLLDFRHLISVVRILFRFRPTVVYLGYANLWTGAFLARFCGVATVFRVMGIHPGMRRALTSPRLMDRAFRWAYRSPWDLVIATQDGSGVDVWLSDSLKTDVPRMALLNGVDPVKPGTDRSSRGRVDRAPSNDSTTVLFVGRLHASKGCIEFVEGFLRAWEQAPSRLKAVIVGDGPLMDEVRGRVAGHAADSDVLFTGLLPHAEVAALHKRTDIYVSLNRFGNLSNANLEAIRSGACMVLPAAHGAIDLVTDQLIPREAAWRIPSVEDTQALSEALLMLHADPERRRMMSEALAAVADDLLPTWEQRVASELEMLQGLR